MFRGKPVVLLSGDGGSGKDTIAAAISRKWSLPYKCSTSEIAGRRMWPQIEEGRFCPALRQERGLGCPYSRLERFNIQPTAFKDFEDFYNARVRHRRFWAEWIDCYNEMSESGAQLYIDAVHQGNHILTGLRKVKELVAFLQTGISDLIIWIDRPGVDRDPTQEYGPERCDIVLRNDLDMERINYKIDRLTSTMVGLQSGGWEL